MYTYVKGNEYEDIFAAWDWNLIPGTTVDYGATPLNCENAQWTGVEHFVGGVSTGDVGIAVMRYTNPYTKTLLWQKAWFFFAGDVQRVMVSNIISQTTSPVYSVLDQRRHDGQIFINDLALPDDPDAQQNQSLSFPVVQSMWHGGIGYAFQQPLLGLSLDIGNKTGDWSTIGISTQPPETVDIFAAWIEHQQPFIPISYTVFPGTDLASFQRKRRTRRLHTVWNDEHVAAVYDADRATLFAVFWDYGGGEVLVATAEYGAVTVRANRNAAMIYALGTGQLTVSDPSQLLPNVQLEIISGVIPDIKTVNVDLPTGGAAGSSVTLMV